VYNLLEVKIESMLDNGKGRMIKDLYFLVRVGIRWNLMGARRYWWLSISRCGCHYRNFKRNFTIVRERDCKNFVSNPINNDYNAYGVMNCHGGDLRSSSASGCRLLIMPRPHGRGH